MNPETERIDLSLARASITSALARIAVLDDTVVPLHADRSRDTSAAKARVAKELLYLAHLCDRARLQVMDEYQVTRGFVDHLESP